MLAYPEMLIDAAKQAGMRCPTDGKPIEVDEGLKARFPHFWVFCVLQLVRPVTYHGEHWENAKVIATIPLPRMLKMTFADFTAEGVVGLLHAEKRQRQTMD